jgi:hypothetical protein
MKFLNGIEENQRKIITRGLRFLAEGALRQLWALSVEEETDQYKNTLLSMVRCVSKILLSCSQFLLIKDMWLQKEI